jgi:hypothetical protein
VILPLTSTLARAIHARDPSLTPTEISREISALHKRTCSRQQVEHAVRATGKPAGRKLDHPQPSSRQREIASAVDGCGTDTIADVLHAEYLRGRRRQEP